MKNYIQDGDFRSVTPGSFTITSAPAIGSFWASSATSLISSITRGTFAASVAAFAGAASAIPSEPSLQKYFQFSISSPVALTTGQFYAQISATIPNGNRIFAGARARFSFWINSTSRAVGIRMTRNFGSGSTTAAQNTDIQYAITPGSWQKVSFDFTVPSFAATDDLEAADYLQFNIVFDNVVTPSVLGFPLNFVETSNSATPTVKVTGVSCELISNNPTTDVYENAAISDTSQLTDKKSLFPSSIATGNLTEATSDVLTITNGAGAVVGTGTSVQVKKASGSQDGFLSSADWATFNGKQSAISGFSGVVTITGVAVLTFTDGILTAASGSGVEES